MPIIVACPSCTGQLRVADDLVGRKVRCPACNTTFDATAPAPSLEEPPAAPALELPIETEKIEGWKHLNLELTPDSGSKPAEEPPPEKPVGAVEIDREEEEDEESTRRGSRRRKPRLRDDHDDLRPCPGCGRMAHRNTRRCISCGESLREEDDDDEDLPRRRRPRRRDGEPHRGGFVLAMGIISVATLFMCWPLAPLAIVPGLIAWIMGQGDLRKIRQGIMDPEGEGTTQAGWICGIIGTCLNTLAVLACGTLVAFIWMESVQNSKNLNRNRPIRPPMVAPPPARQMPR